MKKIEVKNFKIEDSNKTYLKEFLTYANSDGVLPCSSWTTGSGRYITRRNLPKGVFEYNRYDYNLPKKVVKFFNKKENAKKIKCLAYTPNKKN